MSLNVINLEAPAVFDSRLDVNHVRKFAVLKGGALNSYTVFKSPNIPSGQFSILANPPSPDIITSRYALLHLKLQVTGSFAGNSGDVFVQGQYAPRAYPISKIISTQSMKIGNGNVSVGVLNHIWEPISRLHNERDSSYEHYSMTPTMSDTATEYSNVKPYGAQGTNKDPLADYFQNSYQDCRGGFWGITLGTTTQVGNNRVQTIDLDLVEPLFLLSPFVHDNNYAQDSGLIGISNLTYEAVLGDLNRCLSINNAGPNGVITLSNAKITSNPELLLQFFNPSSLMKIPKEISYPYFELLRVSTVAQGNFPAGSTASIQMNSQNLNSVPSKLIVYVEMQDQDKKEFTSDFFFGIENVNIKFNNQTLLSEATPFNLYEMAQRNGFNGSFTQWYRINGSVLPIHFGTDIQLIDPAMCVGQLMKGNLQVSVTAKNISRFDFSDVSGSPFHRPQLCVVIVSTGVINIVNGSVVSQIGVVSKPDVLAAVADPNVTLKQNEKVDAQAGGLMHNSNYRSGRSDVSSYSSNDGGDLVGGKRRKHEYDEDEYEDRKRSNKMKAGKMMTRKQLKKALESGNMSDSDEEY